MFPKLVTRWRGGFLKHAPAALRCVSARGGVVLAAGPSGLFRVPAGEDSLDVRPLPEGLDDVSAIAVEPRKTARLAVAHGRRVAVLDGAGTTTLSIPSGEVKHLAWGPHPSGESVLYIVDDDRMPRCANVETRVVEEPPIDFIDAMASDENGQLAMATSDPGDQAVLLTRDAMRWHWRLLEAPDPDIWGWELTLAGNAVAVHVFDQGVWVSRGLDEPFARCEALGKGGPVAFEGADEGSPLLCAVSGEFEDTIVQVDFSGATTRVATVDWPEGQNEPCVRELAWDGSRGALWAVVEGAGLLRLAPGDEGRDGRRIRS
jgi:hypothetical protein